MRTQRVLKENWRVSCRFESRIAGSNKYHMDLRSSRRALDEDGAMQTEPAWRQENQGELGEVLKLGLEELELSEQGQMTESEVQVLRVATMELALLYAGNAEAVMAVYSACPPVVSGPIGQRTMFRAAIFNKPDVLQALFDGGADPNGCFGYHLDGTTPLHVAAYNGHHECVEALLRAGAIVNSACMRGFTPLHSTTYSRPCRIRCARRLLLAGAECSLRDRLGHMPVCYAVEYGDVKMVNVILQHHMGVLAKNGRTLWDVYGNVPQCRHRLQLVFSRLFLQERSMFSS